MIVAKTMPKNAATTVSINAHNKKGKILSGLYLANVFISKHSTTHKHFYLSLLHKKDQNKNMLAH